MHMVSVTYQNVLIANAFFLLEKCVALIVVLWFEM